MEGLNPCRGTIFTVIAEGGSQGLILARIAGVDTLTWI